MTKRIPDPPSEFESEGEPDPGSALPGKVVTGDAQEGLSPPGDRPVGVNAWGTTAEEEIEGEPLAARLAEEEPDLRPEGSGREQTDGGPVRASDDRGPDPDDPTLDRPFGRSPGQDVGRLVDTDEGAGEDTEADLAAFSADTDEGGFTAEEEAMHLDPDT